MWFCGFEVLLRDVAGGLARDRGAVWENARASVRA
jgi:hypothetical protein